MSAIRDQNLAVEFSLVEPLQCFLVTLTFLSSDDPAHPICSRAIDGYVPIISAMNKKNEVRKKKTIINSDEV